MNSYLCFQTVLVIFNVSMQIMGRVWVHKGHYLGCTAGGYEWMFTTTTGDFFVTAHMILVILQALMLEKAHYAIPEKIGYFDLPEDMQNNRKEIEMRQPEYDDDSLREKTYETPRSNKHTKRNSADKFSANGKTYTRRSSKRGS